MKAIKIGLIFIYIFLSIVCCAGAVNYGYYLTQSAEVADNDRTFITAIKGMNVNEADWSEVTLEEKEAFEKAQEEKSKEDE